MALEAKREDLQAQVDSQKSIEARRKRGQFATPFALAEEIAAHAARLCDQKSVSFLEPCVGTGAFYAAMQDHFLQISHATGYELDSDYYAPAVSLWHDIDLHNEDFLAAVPDAAYDLLLTNPPYVRHHYLPRTQKEALQQAVRKELGIRISGLAGLYCYFLLLSHKWLKPGALCAWLIPSEFMDVAYGTAVKHYLLDHVHLLRIHRYEPTDLQFEDALVSSCVVWFRNEAPSENNSVKFSYGGTHEAPKHVKNVALSILRKEQKWTRFPEKEVRVAGDDPVLGDYFTIKRGIATGSNRFFVLERQRAEELGIASQFLQPILPSPRYLKTDFIEADTDGNPTIQPQLFLLNCRWDERRIREEFPSLWSYLESGIETVATKYLCKSRKVWYWQEERKPTPFLCSYMGRGSDERSAPIRFIYNQSEAIVANSYLMLYPKKSLQEVLDKAPDIAQDIWEELKQIGALAIEDEGRVYGGGLKKVEPKELAQVKCNGLEKFCTREYQMVLFRERKKQYRVS